ncbi:MAG: MATE family efflux transporter [Clostridia bacterium]|nr:MATE family efflux transporter [Clostridia bacterium]
MSFLKRRNVDMLNGPILKSLIIFGLPIFFGSVFQQLYNMVDSIVVGKYVSANALAAVGSTGTISMLLVGVMMGFPTGASIVAAQFLGAGQKDKIKTTISTTMIFMVILSIIMTVIGLCLSSFIMGWVNVPDEIYADTVLYFRIFIGGMLFMALYNFFASFLRALGDSTTPLIFLIISSLLNIAGDLFFVLVLRMGVAGVAIATVLAQAVSVVLCFIYVSKNIEYFKFSKSEFVFDKVLFKDILRLGLPSSLQSSITGIGMVMVQSLINSFGPVSIAAYTAANKMEALCNLPMTGISMALSLFVGQNIGANNQKRAQKGLNQSIVLSVVLSAVMSLLIFLFGKNIMTLFVNESEIEVINVGATFMRTWAPLVFAHGICSCSTAFLRGAGDSFHAMISMFFDLIVRTVFAYFFALTLNMGFMGIAYALPCGWIGCSLYSMIRYYTGGWRKKSVIRR